MSAALTRAQGASSLSAFGDALARQPGVSRTFADAVQAHAAMQPERAMERAFRLIRESVDTRHRAYVKDRARELLRQPQLLDLTLRDLSLDEPAEGLRRCRAQLAMLRAEEGRRWNTFTLIWNLRAAILALRVLRRADRQAAVRWEVA